MRCPRCAGSDREVDHLSREEEHRDQTGQGAVRSSRVRRAPRTATVTPATATTAAPTATGAEMNPSGMCAILPMLIANLLQ